jgi:hypothetical protein
MKIAKHTMRKVHQLVENSFVRVFDAFGGEEKRY